MPRTPKLTDGEQVAAFMDALHHPLKPGMEQLRALVKATDSGIGERIKWNAPSYVYRAEDFLTFGPPQRDLEKILLVFHHPQVANINSPLLEGSYKDRRLAYFDPGKSVDEQSAELQRIIRELIAGIDAGTAR